MDTIEHADIYLLLIRSSDHMAFPTLEHRISSQALRKGL